MVEAAAAVKVIVLAGGPPFFAGHDLPATGKAEAGIDRPWSAPGE